MYLIYSAFIMTGQGLEVPKYVGEGAQIMRTCFVTHFADAPAVGPETLPLHLSMKSVTDPLTNKEIYPLPKIANYGGILLFTAFVPTDDIEVYAPFYISPARNGEVAFGRNLKATEPPESYYQTGFDDSINFLSGEQTTTYPRDQLLRRVPHLSQLIVDFRTFTLST